MMRAMMILMMTVRRMKTRREKRMPITKDWITLCSHTGHITAERKSTWNWTLFETLDTRWS